MDVERALVFVNACGRGYNWIKLRFYLWLKKGFFSLNSSYNFNTDTGWLSGNFNTENSFSFGFLCLFKKSNAPNFFCCRSDSGEAGTSIMGFHGIWSLRNYWLLMHFLLKYISFQVFWPLVNSPIRLNKCLTSPWASLIVWPSPCKVEVSCQYPICFPLLGCINSPWFDNRWQIAAPSTLIDQKPCKLYKNLEFQSTSPNQQLKLPPLGSCVHEWRKQIALATQS